MDMWDLHQDGKIRSAKDKAATANNKAERAESKVKDLQRQVDHLTLLCQSLWELIRENTEITDEQFRVKIADVDTRDGKSDGKIGAQIFPCPSCGANCNTTRQSCMMCGEDLKAHKPHIFEA